MAVMVVGWDQVLQRRAWFNLKSGNTGEILNSQTLQARLVVLGTNLAALLREFGYSAALLKTGKLHNVSGNSQRTVSTAF